MPHHRRALHGALAAVALALVGACASGELAILPLDTTTQASELKALPRPLTPAEQGLIASANTFSFSLFKQVGGASKDSNVFVSPLSADFALGMTMGGAAGATYDQMRSALAFGTASEPDINTSYRSLLTLLTSLDPATNMRVANSIWYRNSFPFNQAFLDASKATFSAEVRGLDFGQPSARTTINDWVSGATSAKITTIIDEITPEQVMFLINAIYFKGSWRDRFDPAQTKDELFHGVAGDQPMRLMHRKGTMRFLFRTDLSAVDLPYGNGAYSMSVILPAAGTSVDQVAATLTPATWNTLVGQFHDMASDLWLPKLKLEWQRTLNDDLKTLGIRDAFVPDGADFTRMSSSAGRHLFIDKVRQKTYVDVNEEGTEAAAVTSVGVGVTSLPPSVRVDRPYILVIRERLSGTIVFMGKIVRMPPASS